jgi:hypothetical protein
MVLAFLLLGYAIRIDVADAAQEIARPAEFDRGTWEKDFDELKFEMEHSYANLGWFASPQSGIDLPKLERRTQRLLSVAESDSDAQAAILAFVASFHDGHFSAVAKLEPAMHDSRAPPKADFDKMSPIEGCAALGYAPASRIAFSLPFESLAGAKIESDGITRVFRAMTISGPLGKRIGIVRIPRFRPEDSPPGECIHQWEEQKKKNSQHVDTDTLKEELADAWFRALCAQLKKFSADSVSAVVVDVGGNSGGNDSGDWSPRLFSDKTIRSAPLFMAATPAAVAYFDEQLGELRSALKKLPDGETTSIIAIKEAIGAFENRKLIITQRQCDMSWVWREKREWSPAGCSGLVQAGFASGQLDYMPAGAIPNKDAASSIYWPAQVDAFRAAWSGPVFVITDGETASSAEMFSAVMQDNKIAKTVGRPTMGDGCGFMADVDPIELSHSHLRFRVPNCVRLRADGTDEVAGVRPDIPILPRHGEGNRARAYRAISEIEAELSRQMANNKAN